MQQSQTVFDLPYELRHHIGVVNHWRSVGQPLPAHLERPSLGVAEKLTPELRRIYLAALKR